MKALALAVLLAAPAAAQDARAAATEQAAIAQAAARGALIYAYDQAAWHGTDDMRAKVPDAASKVAGYLADGPADAPRLIFFDRQPTPHAYYVAQFRRGRLVSGRVLGPADDTALAPEALRRLRALAVATATMRQSGLRACGGGPFNSVVLPADAAGTVRVYFLTPQTDNDHLPFGGHYVVEVAADDTASAPRAFSRSCLSLPTHPPAGPNGATAVGVSVSHLLDPVPTEIHVFASLAMGKPVFVATLNPTPRLWSVAGTRITGPRSLPVAR